MSISTSVNLYVFLASDILENVNYKQVHKQAKLIIKRNNMKRIPYSYCIFYIERKYYQNINKELKEKGYKKYVPLSLR